MAMMNKAAYQELTQANMPEPQTQVAVSYIRDWSQFATRDELSRLGKGMSQLESRLVRRMDGIFQALLALLGGLVTIALNVTAIVSALQNFQSAVEPARGRFHSLSFPSRQNLSGAQAWQFFNSGFALQSDSGLSTPRSGAGNAAGRAVSPFSQ